MTRLLYLLFVISGAAGLVYEVLWANLLGGLVGGTTATHTVVLAAFMGGLALGNRFGGRWADLGTTPLRLYAYLEAAVGALGLLSPKLADLAGATYVALAPDPSGSMVFLDGPLRLVLAVLVILPASFAMGATLPVLVRACTTTLGGLGASVGRLYFINSVGAMAGALLASFWVIPTFGLDFGLVLTGLTNLLLALVALVAARSEVVGDESAPVEATAANTNRTYTAVQARAAVAAVVLSGGAAMVIEVVWTRVLALTMGGSAYAFAIMLATFIGGIAVGGLIAARVAGDDRDAYRPLIWAEGIAAVSLIVLLPWYDHLPWLFHGAASVLVPEPHAYAAYLAICTAIAVVAMFVPTVALGATLPLASRVVTSSLGHAGRKVGGVFSWNTLGNVVGAVLGGLVLVSLVGLELTMRFGALLLVAAVLRLLWPLQDGDTFRTRGFGVALLAALAVVIAPGWDPVLIHSGLYRSLEAKLGSVSEVRNVDDIKFLFDTDDAEATVAVIERDSGTRLLRVNGKSDASSGGDVPTQVLVGQLPMLFHPAPKRVLVVGLGSGITVGSVLTHDSVEHVDVVEISSAIVEASRFFDRWSGAPLDDPRVTLHVRDARNLLRVLPEDARYDVIVSEPSNPWQPGSAMLFTEEYYQLLEKRLADGGVLSQWVHTYEMDDTVLGVILQTFGKVFDKGARVFNTRRNDMVLLSGRQPPAADFERLARVLGQPKVAADLKRTRRDKAPLDLATLLLHEVMGPKAFELRYTKRIEAPVHSDRFPVLQYVAPKAFFVRAKAKTFVRGDARLGQRRGSELLLARLLGNRTLTLDELEAIDRYLSLKDYRIERGLAGAVALHLWMRQPDDPERLARLGQLGLLEEVAKRRRDALLESAGSPSSVRDCRQRLKRGLEKLRLYTSVLTPTSLSRYDALRDQCLSLFPAMKSQLQALNSAAKRYRYR